MVKRINKISLISLLCVSQFFLFSSAYADVGPPPPSMSFYFYYEVPKSQIISIDLYVCEDPDCVDKTLFLGSGNFYESPAGLYCHMDSCWAIARTQSFKRYHQMIITFDTGMIKSNVFTKTSFDANYEVRVKENSLFIQEMPPDSIFDYFSPLQKLLFIPALFLTIIAETITAAIYSRKIRTQIRMVILANIISLPFVWFAFPFLQVEFPIMLFLGETFVIVFEASFLYYLNRQTGITIRQASFASVLMNLASFVIGAIPIFTLFVISFLLD